MLISEKNIDMLTKKTILFCSNLCLAHELFDVLMGFVMSLIWGQKEEVTEGEQGMTKHWGPAGGRDGDSLGFGYKRQVRVGQQNLE